MFPADSSRFMETNEDAELDSVPWFQSRQMFFFVTVVLRLVRRQAERCCGPSTPAWLAQVRLLSLVDEEYFSAVGALLAICIDFLRFNCFQSVVR